jgi:DNA-directed RNA polymerase subunit RPC12/RpoP
MRLAPVYSGTMSSAAATLLIQCSECGAKDQYNKAAEAGWEGGGQPFTYVCNKCIKENK